VPRKHLRRSRKQILSPQVWRTRLTFWTGALLVGIAATLLAKGSDLAGHYFSLVLAQYPYAPFLITPMGLMVIAWSTHRFFPGAEGSGIPQAIAALQMRDKALRSSVLSMRIAISKGIMIWLGLLSGASIGREGPTVHVAASVTYALSRFARFPYHAIGRGLILAGGAAGLAAAFNTPLAGIIFAIEEMARSFEERTSGTIFTAVIIAGMVALAIHGNYYYFGTVNAQMEPLHTLAAIVACGTVGGLLGGVFSMLLIQGNRRIGPVRGRHPVVIAFLCGLALAVFGWFSSGMTYGTGYEEARRLLEGGESTGWAFPIMKLGATVASYWSGIPGGIFAPSLSVGAGMGAEIARSFPSEAVAAVTLLGMVAYFTGVVQTPITAVVIVMEMTDDQSLLLSLMATALIADGISHFINPRPIYRALADDFLNATHRKSKRAPVQASD